MLFFSWFANNTDVLLYVSFQMLKLIYDAISVHVEKVSAV